MTKRKSTTANGQESSRAKSSRPRGPSLEEIEEKETCLWVEEQLNRIRNCLVEHGADDEMLDAVDYLLEDNKGWINDQIASDLREGKLREGEA
jgi:hypothetical protein